MCQVSLKCSIGGFSGEKFMDTKKDNKQKFIWTKIDQKSGDQVCPFSSSSSSWFNTSTEIFKALMPITYVFFIHLLLLSCQNLQANTCMYNDINNLTLSFISTVFQYRKFDFFHINFRITEEYIRALFTQQSLPYFTR